MELHRQPPVCAVCGDIIEGFVGDTFRGLKHKCKSNMEKIKRSLQSLMLSMKAHPDYDPYGGEFFDLVNIAEKSLGNVVKEETEIHNKAVQECIDELRSKLQEQVDNSEFKRGFNFARNSAIRELEKLKR